MAGAQRKAVPMNADHPSWCDPSECTAGEANGAHRSTPIIISPVSIALQPLPRRRKQS